MITEGLVGEESHTIEPTSYTPEEATLVNKHAKNGYMLRLWFYEFVEPLSEMIAKNDAYYDADDDYNEDEKSAYKKQFLATEVFYKGVGLKLIAK